MAAAAELDRAETSRVPRRHGQPGSGRLERGSRWSRPAAERSPDRRSIAPSLAQRTRGYERASWPWKTTWRPPTSTHAGYQPESNTMKDVIRIVLVDPLEESRTSLQRLLGGITSLWLSEVLSSYQEAANRAKEIAGQRDDRRPRPRPRPGHRSDPETHPGQPERGRVAGEPQLPTAA